MICVCTCFFLHFREWGTPVRCWTLLRDQFMARFFDKASLNVVAIIAVDWAGYKSVIDLAGSHLAGYANHHFHLAAEDIIITPSKFFRKVNRMMAFLCCHVFYFKLRTFANLPQWNKTTPLVICDSYADSFSSRSRRLCYTWRSAISSCCFLHSVKTVLFTSSCIQRNLLTASLLGSNKSLWQKPRPAITPT